MSVKSIIMGVAAIVLATLSAQAVDTTITVRVLAKDAKFIGTSMGGAKVTIRDVATGKVLAEGLTAGGTGDTGLIMRTPRARGGSIASDGSAYFSATLDLNEPRLIEVSAKGPLTPNSSAVTASSQQWVVQGKHIGDGDAWLVELRGLVVEVIDLPAEVDGKTVTLQAKVRMLCGCPTSPGGMWDSDQMEIVALLEKAGTTTEVPLGFSGTTSHFAATVPVEKGSYQATFYAYQKGTGNTGVMRAGFVVR